MSKILVTPEEMEKASKLFADGFNQSEALVNKLNSTMQQMHGQWEGMTQQKFFEQYETTKKNMETYKTMLMEVSKELAAIATRFKQADQQG